MSVSDIGNRFPPEALSLFVTMQRFNLICFLALVALASSAPLRQKKEALAPLAAEMPALVQVEAETPEHAAKDATVAHHYAKIAAEQDAVLAKLNAANRKQVTVEATYATTQVQFLTTFLLENDLVIATCRDLKTQE